MLLGDIHTLHTSMGLVTLVVDGLRNDKLHSFSDSQHGRVFGYDWKEGYVHSVRHNRTGSNFIVFNLQVGVFQSHLLIL